MQLFNPPLKCDAHPDNEAFVKVRTCESQIDSRGRKLKGSGPATIKVIYVCMECDDLVHQEPLREQRSIKR